MNDAKTVESLPRPEYPRPDFRRDEWLNLNGFWDFKFDDYDLGEKEGWFLDKVVFDKKILVPFPYQSKLSGIYDESFHDIVWYRKEFSIPEKWNGKRVLLHFGAVDYKTKVWLNGRLLGSHTGGYTPFSFDITDYLKENNLLFLRVFDPHGDQPRGKQDSRLHPRGARYMRITGIWQTVWMETVGDTYLTSVRIVPDLDEAKVKILASLKGETKGCKLLATVYFAGNEEANAEEEIDKGLTQLEITLPYVNPWSPETPDIYDIEFKVSRNGEVIDVVRSYFGMRKISVKGDKILLNNEPYYLKMALDQGYYPDGLYTAPSDDDLRRDVEAAKLLGFNGVRKHQLASDPRYLYWCDKLGLLVWEEMADWGMPLKMKDIFWEEWKRVIERDFNHPCIVVWVPFNERWEAYEDKECQEILVEIYRKTKALDPTRLVIDTSGFAHTETDIVDTHEYRWKRGYDFRKEWRMPHERKEPMRGYRPPLAKGFKYKGQPIVISEWGGWGIEKFNPIVNRPKWAYHMVPDEYAFISLYRDVVGAIMEEKAICGFCYTQLYDVEGEVNGFLTYDRKWKIPPEKIAEIHKKKLANS